MADEKWQKVRETFDSALRQKPEERRKFVHEAAPKNRSDAESVEQSTYDVRHLRRRADFSLATQRFSLRYNVGHFQ
ncbi:MAG TPA: hypothetical protein VGP58_12650 [Pyrinomonadaceae bacterium]|jgi:chlorite dismutase|nr:hypothetical protein [Pyrinomonadaceae bacterium]